VLPDHMHEGLCEIPPNLTTEYTFADGITKIREYPDYTPVSPPPGFLPIPLKPEVVANGKINYNGEPFGVIAAWDGHRVQKGRVVVDSTWHHFVNVNLTGDRSPGNTDQQKRRGFYVLSNNNVLVPNEAYKKIMWYYRNIIYWLIPAKRKKIIWDVVQQIRDTAFFRNEFMTLGKNIEISKFSIYDFLRWGHIAEAYFKKARGGCAKYKLIIIIDEVFKPKIPWYEWVMDIADPWDPIKTGPISKQIMKARTLAAAGLGPDPELLGTVRVGAALLTSVILEQADREVIEKLGFEKLAAEKLEEVYKHASDAYFDGVNKAAQILSKLGGVKKAN